MSDAITAAFATLKDAFNGSIGEVAKSLDMAKLTSIVGYAKVVADLESNWNAGNPPGGVKAASSGRRGRPRKVREGMEGVPESAADAVQADATADFQPGEVTATQVEFDAPPASSSRRRNA